MLSALIVTDEMANRTYSSGRAGHGMVQAELWTSSFWACNRRAPELARQSRGDSLSVYDASALEMTLASIRQRYAVYFHLPPDAKSGQERSIDVQLAEPARRRYLDVELRFRKTYVSSSTTSGMRW